MSFKHKNHIWLESLNQFFHMLLASSASKAADIQAKTHMSLKQVIKKLVYKRKKIKET